MRRDAPEAGHPRQEAQAAALATEEARAQILRLATPEQRNLEHLGEVQPRRVASLAGQSRGWQRP